VTIGCRVSSDTLELTWALEGNDRHELYFMCDDLKAEISTLGKKGVQCFQVQEARWGSITHIRLPGGGEVCLYQPKHPTALAVSSK
jgi:hypothetical protein